MELNKYKDGTNNRIIRKSALIRIILGTASTTTICLIYSFTHARYRNLEKTFIKNWFKGSLITSLSFYILNEALIISTKFLNIYSNFWINYTLICYYLSKIHYRYLIRNNIMKWYNAIRYSHKCFLYFCIFNLSIEMILFTIREAYLYDEEDVIDRLNRFLNKSEAKYLLSYDDIVENFISPVHVLNNLNKVSNINTYMKENPNGSRINTIDLYEYYKNKNN